MLLFPFDKEKVFCFHLLTADVKRYLRALPVHVRQISAKKIKKENRKQDKTKMLQKFQDLNVSIVSNNLGQKHLSVKKKKKKKEKSNKHK